MHVLGFHRQTNELKIKKMSLLYPAKHTQCTVLTEKATEQPGERPSIGLSLLQTFPNVAFALLRYLRRALIGYSCGVLLVYPCVNSASIGSTDLFFFHPAHERKSLWTNSSLRFNHRKKLSWLTQVGSNSLFLRITSCRVLVAPPTYC